MQLKTILNHNKIMKKYFKYNNKQKFCYFKSKEKFIEEY